MSDDPSPLPPDGESAAASGAPGGLPVYPNGGAPDVAAYGTNTTAGAPPPAHWGWRANWGWRALSGLIDALIVAIPNTIVHHTLHPFAGAMAEVAISLAGITVFAWMEGTTGRTPGKMVAGTRTLREADGRLLGFGRALGRRFLHILDILPCYLGFLWPAWDAKKQTFADKLVSSVVVKG